MIGILVKVTFKNNSYEGFIVGEVHPSGCSIDKGNVLDHMKCNSFRGIDKLKENPVNLDYNPDLDTFFLELCNNNGRKMKFKNLENCKISSIISSIQYIRSKAIQDLWSSFKMTDNK